MLHSSASVFKIKINVFLDTFIQKRFFLETGMSRLTGLRYTKIHDAPDTFRGSTPDRCFRSLYTGNSDFPIRYIHRTFPMVFPLFRVQERYFGGTTH